MRIAFVYNALTYFTKIDLDILDRNFIVNQIYFKEKLQILRFFKYFKIIYKSEIVICWFSSWHTFFPLLFSKFINIPFILIAGGYDSANVPESQYGNQRIWWKRLITNFSLRNADVLIVNSNFIKNEILSLGGIDGDKIFVIYHGIPVNNLAILKKESIALNVGNLSNENILRKGIGPFLHSAKYFSTWKFIHVGKWENQYIGRKYEQLSSNVELKGYANYNNLVELFKSASVYIQPSLHEGFGLSVIEAMQYGCIPIISKNGALPEIVKNYGLILDNLLPETIASTIPQAIEQFDLKRLEIQKYVNENFNLEKREAAFVKLLSGMKF